MKRLFETTNYSFNRVLGEYMNDSRIMTYDEFSNHLRGIKSSPDWEGFATWAKEVLKEPDWVRSGRHG